jgi:uncharacterized protein (DUF1786 family)
MKILAIDIGAGTEDILLFDSQKKNIENCIKLVLPSPTQTFATKVRAATRHCKDIFVEGDTIGGGAFTSALKAHVEKGLRVVMAEKAAYTIRNDLEEVKQLGIEVVREENETKDFKGETLTIEEVNLNKLQMFLEGLGETLSDVDVVAVAVQDHGVFPMGISNRKFRIKKLKALLKESPKPENLAFKEEEIPPCFLRMKSAAQASRRQLPKAEVLLMDTSPDAILGCLKDPPVEKANPIIAVNVGNGHTMAAIISNGEIVGMLEHHTQLLNSQKIERLLVDFANGDLTNEEVFKDGGHGLFFLAAHPCFSEIDEIVATGPNRSLLSKTKFSVYFAAPAGDVMMTGPVGLIEAAKIRFARRSLFKNSDLSKFQVGK